MNAPLSYYSVTSGSQGIHCPLKAPNALLADFIQFYTHSAARCGIAVDVEAMRGVAREFLRTHPLDSLSFSDCRRLLIEVEGRQLPPFDRILLDSLRPLLPRFGNTPGAMGRTGRPVLPRRTIPGLLTAMSAMLGQERTERLRHRAEVLAAVHLSPAMGDTDWSALTQDPECAAIQEEAALALVGHFKAFDRRLAWLIAVIDAHAPRPSNISEQDWRFEERQALALLRALTKQLRAVRKATGAGALALHCAPKTLRAVDRFFATLDERLAAAHIAA